MKRKIILALLAAMTLTVGSVGTVFAAVNNGGTEIQTTDPEEPEQHTHTWGDAYYVKDADAVYEQVKVVDQEEKWDWVTNIITPAWDENITEVQDICYSCEAKGIHTQFVNGAVVGTGESLQDHVTNHMLNGESGAYGSREVVVDTIHHEAVTEDVWTKIQDEISHMEDVLVTPEQGHWEHTCAECGEIQNRDTGEVIKPGTITPPENPGTDTPENPDIEQPEDPDTETPENPDMEQPENPDIETPESPDTEQPENPDTETPENPSTEQPENPDTETPESPDTEQPENPDAETPGNDNQSQDTTENTQGTVKGTEVTQDNTQPETSEDNTRKSPKTGDPANFIYLATFAGSALTGGTAFGLRKKFKK